MLVTPSVDECQSALGDALAIVVNGAGLGSEEIAIPPDH
jgi:hypothetical protein